ncbi:MAG: carboxymethylenebutenolidase [Acidimicrobiales bacterium]|jgi:carboxymethylenebutenolidase
MIEHHLDLTTPDGEMPTFIVHPEEDGPHPVILFQMDAPGMREELHNMCRRLATGGYYVMAPMFYYRDVREYNLFETGDRDRMFELMSNVGNTRASADAGVCFAHAAADSAADATRIGTVGYCMSGPFTIAVAADYPDIVKAAASIHGVALVTDEADSPHARLPELNAEIYIGCAENDHYAPPEMIEAFEEAMATAGTAGKVEWFPGTEHGFAFAERPVYVQAASERHWEQVQSLFRRTLT